MKHYRLLLAIGAVLGMLMGSHGCGCNGDDAPPLPMTGGFELSFVPTVGGQSLGNNIPVTNVQGRSFYTEKLLMYVSDIVLVKENGAELLLSETKLFDLGNGDEAKKTSHGEGAFATFSGEELIGEYKGVKFAIGIPSRLNHSNPDNFPTAHPLTSSYGTHWNQTNGYHFFSLEGKIDDSPTMNGTAYNTSLSYHLGTDTLYRPLSFLETRHAFSIADGDELQFVIEIDIDRLFYTATDTVNMVIQHQTESQNSAEIPDGFDLAQKMMDNLVTGAMFKRPF